MATYLGKAPARLAIVADDQITSAKIVDNTVTSADILNATITGADLASDITINTTGTVTTSQLNLGDNEKIFLGTSGSDFDMFHQGSYTALRNFTGNLYLGAPTSGGAVVITNQTISTTSARFDIDGPVELFYNNAKKFETTSSGATVTGTLVADGVSLGDNETINAGASNDLQIYHNGTNSYIDDNGGGILILRSDSRINLRTKTGNEEMIEANPNGSVELYYDASKKIETTSTGATVTGNLGVENGEITVSDGTTCHQIGNDGNQIYFGANALNSNSGGLGNIAIGYQAMCSNVSGCYNTAVGHEALVSNVSDAGSYNTAHGYQALYSNTTGEKNTAIGYQSMYANTTGEYNAAIGTDSLRSNTIGQQNVALGHNSLYCNTSGFGQVAAGYKSLFNNTTGNYNVAFGAYSLECNTIGSCNIAIGYESVKVHTNGLYNIGIGYQTMKNLTVGNSNVSLGLNTMLTQTTGYNNIAIGVSALEYNVDGCDNIAIGLSAMRGVTNGNPYSNIALGNWAGCCLCNGQYNVMLGNSAGRCLIGDTNYNNSSFNVIIGQSAGGQTATLSSAVLIGRYAGPRVTGDGSIVIGQYANSFGCMSSGNQILIGPYSGCSLTTGGSNILIGSYAANFLTTGNENLIIGGYYKGVCTSRSTVVGIGAAGGNLPQYGCITAIGHTAGQCFAAYEGTFLGACAGRNTTSGSGITALGMCSLVFNVTGGQDTAVGALTLANSTAGFNTAIGYKAGCTLTTGCNNIIIGRCAQPSSASVCNEITLGDANVTCFRIPFDGTSCTNICMGMICTRAPNAGYAAGVNILGEFGASVDQRTLLKVKNYLSNPAASAAMVGYDMDVANWYCHYTGGISGARARSFIGVRQITQTNSGGDSFWSSPRDLNFYVNNEADVTVSSGECQSNSVLPGTLAMKMSCDGLTTRNGGYVGIRTDSTYSCFAVNIPNGLCGGTGFKVSNVSCDIGYGNSTQAVAGPVVFGPTCDNGYRSIFTIASKQISDTTSNYVNGGDGTITELRFIGTGTDGSTAIQTGSISTVTDDINFGNSITSLADMVFTTRGNGATNRESSRENLRIQGNGRIHTNGTKNLTGHLNLIGERGQNYKALVFEHTSGGGEVGNITTGSSSVAYNTSSDYRLKENVVDMSNATDRLKQLKPKRFNFISDESNTPVDGFLAHEVSSIVPEAITGEKDAVDENSNPVYQGIDQSKLVPVLTKALQEAITKIEELEARINTLENV